MLTNTFKISANTMGEIFQFSFPQNDEKHDKKALMEIFQVFGVLSNVDCQGVFPNGVY